MISRRRITQAVGLLILVISIGFIRNPWFGNAPKAAAISSGVASPAPSAIGRNGGSSPARPSFLAYSIPVSIPFAWRVFTAGTLRLCSSARLRGIGPQ